MSTEGSRVTGFKVVDRRGSSRLQAGVKDFDAEIRRLKSKGYTLPTSKTAARREVDNIDTSMENKSLQSSMRKLNARRVVGSDVALALPKMREPLSSLRDKGIPFDVTNPKELQDIRRWCRLFYTTHDLIPLLIDIYSKFPVVGMEIESNDKLIKSFQLS